MNTTPKGKIGRLPKSIQEQVNRRLDNREKGHHVVAWLNSLPEVQAILASEFNGKPIREQNLSQWRKHGYQQWTWRQEAQSMAAEIGNLPVAGTAPLSDQMATWVSVRYLRTVRALVENKTKDEAALKILRSFSRDVVALRRGDQGSARLKMQQDRRKHQPRSS